MNVLIVSSGNASDGQPFDIKLNHPFIYEQVSQLEKHDISFDFFYIKGRGVLGYLKSILELSKFIKSKDYDVIHAHYGLSAVVSAFQRKIPLIATFHGCDVNRRSLNIFSSFAALMAKANIFVSDDLLRKIFLKTPQKNTMIPCGIDLHQFIPIEKQEARKILNLDLSRTYVLFASSKEVPVKNITLAYNALENFTGIELLELANKTREEVNLLMNACDVFLMTSLREGSPQTIKEAMACNCPIVSTDVGDVRKVTGNTDGCFICSFDPIDVEKKLGLALEFVKVNGRTNGRERLVNQGLDLETIACKIIKVYNKVASKNGK